MTTLEAVCADATALYGKQIGFIDLDYKMVMEQAIPLVRTRKFNRADALSMVYDFLLSKHGNGEWKRMGEVVMLRSQSVARALCTRV